MLEKLASLEARYNELTEEIAKPEVIADQTTWQKLMKAHADLEPVVETYRAYKAALEAVDEAKGILEEEKDAELRELAQMQLDEQREEAANLEQQLKILLLPKDPNDDKNVILEIRAGTGGDEAGLFAGDLQKMYSRYADRMGWRQDILSSSYTDLGGIKEIVILLEGRGAYSKLKFESVCRKPNRAGEFTPLPPRWLCCRKPRKWSWNLPPATFGWICSAPAAPAANASTQPKAQCA